MKDTGRFSLIFWASIFIGIIFLISALLISVPILQLLSNDGNLAEDTTQQAREIQALFFFFGGGIILLGYGAERFFSQSLKNLTSTSFNLFFLICFLSSALFILEAGLSIIDKSSDKALVQIQGEKSAERFFEYDPTLGWKNKPGISTTFSMPDSSTEVITNKNGFREKKDFLLEKSRKRALFTGDSFVWGYGIEQGERFTDIVRKKLKSELEIINTGVNGYGLDQQLLFYQKYGYRFKADFVIGILGFDDLADLLIREGKPYFTLRDGKLLVQNIPVEHLKDGKLRKIEETSFLHDVLSKSRIYRFAKKRIVTTYKHRKAFALAKALLESYNNAVQNNEAQFTILLKPNKELVQSGRQYELYLKLSEYLKELEIPFIDPFLKLQAGNFENPVFFEHDSHWNVHGHAIVGGEVLQYLESRNK